MKYLKITAILFLCLFMYACGDTPAEEAKAANEEKIFDNYRLGADADFLVDYAAFLHLSIRMNELADEKIENEQITVFAQDMLEDHQTLRKELRKLAEQYNIELPAALSTQQKSQLDFLESGDEGIIEKDQIFLNHIIRLHQDWNEPLNDVIANTKVEAILDFARKINAHQFRHMEEAKRLLDKSLT